MKSAVYILFLIHQVFSEHKWLESDDGSKFYLEIETKYNWFQAWSECARKNMSLIAIDTPAKHEQIDHLLKGTYKTPPTAWISGNNLGFPARFEWASTGEQITFANWGPGQPADALNDEHCILMWIDFKWHDGNCVTHQHGYICEENRLVKGKCSNESLIDLREKSKGQNIIFYFNNGN